MTLSGLASLASALVITTALAANAQTTLTIDVDHPAGKVSPTLYGLMTEEINHSYDGGLYAELVQNRALMDDPAGPAHWSLVQGDGALATMSLDHAVPLNDVLTNSLRLDAVTVSESRSAGVANDGYWGVPVKPHTKYRASFYAKASDEFTGPVTVSLESADGSETFARAKVRRVGSEWKRFTVTLKTGSAAATANGRLVLSVNHPGTIWFDVASLFPPTWRNRPNGNRMDIMQLLSDMRPAFLRFPGGNYVEGDTLETRFDWKKTIGPIERRPGHACCWGYRSSDGMGLLEFLEWCEDLKMEPALAVYAGYNLNHAHIDAGPALEPFVQDALDEIEYVTGDVSTKWGAERARDGHRAPFPLRYVEIGNEDWFDQSGSYDGRFAQFFDAIKAKYPNLKCISTIGTEHPEGQRIKTRKPDVLDEHYYSSAATYEKEAPERFDTYDRKGPEIFVGEWAAYEDVKPWERESRGLPPTPTLKAALADAAWMTGMERNSDLVVMQCYAPMFVNVNPGARQWRPNLIGYNGLTSFGSPSYYAIQMFSRNHGDTILKTSASDSARLLEGATLDAKSGVVFVKLVNRDARANRVAIHLRGVRSVEPEGTAVTLSGVAPDALNTVDSPTRVAPVATQISGVKADFDYTAPPYSVTVLRLHCKL